MPSEQRPAMRCSARWLTAETQTNSFDGFDLDVPEVLTPVAPYVWTAFPGAGAMDDGTDNVYFFDGQVAYEANVMTNCHHPR